MHIHFGPDHAKQLQVTLVPDLLLLLFFKSNSTCLPVGFASSIYSLNMYACQNVRGSLSFLISTEYYLSNGSIQRIYVNPRSLYLKCRRKYFVWLLRKKYPLYLSVSVCCSVIENVGQNKSSILWNWNIISSYEVFDSFLWSVCLGAWI